MGVDFFTYLVAGNLLDLDDVYPVVNDTVIDFNKDSTNFNRIINPKLASYNSDKNDIYIRELKINYKNNDNYIHIIKHKLYEAGWKIADNVKDAYVIGFIVAGCDADFGNTRVGIKKILDGIELSREILRTIGFYREESFELWLVPEIS